MTNDTDRDKYPRSVARESVILRYSEGSKRFDVREV